MEQKLLLRADRKKEWVWINQAVVDTLRGLDCVKVIVNSKDNSIKLYKARGCDTDNGDYYYLVNGNYITVQRLVYKIFFYFDKSHSDKLIFEGEDAKLQKGFRHAIIFKLKEER